MVNMNDIVQILSVGFFLSTPHVFSRLRRIIVTIKCPLSRFEDILYEARPRSRRLILELLKELPYADNSPHDEVLNKAEKSLQLIYRPTWVTDTWPPSAKLLEQIDLKFGLLQSLSQLRSVSVESHIKERPFAYSILGSDGQTNLHRHQPASLDGETRDFWEVGAKLASKDFEEALGRAKDEQ